MRHAIMIMAHADYNQLRSLVEVLDNPAIDIFIHINRRSWDWDESILNGVTSFSKIHFVPRVNIYYCDYSQVKAQISLLKSATEIGYDYYHIISGTDLPLHPIPDFLEFFKDHSENEFIGISANYDKRLSGIKAFFSNSIRTSKGLKRKILLRLSSVYKNIQLKSGINLSKGFDGIPFKGCDWWSITHNAALYLLDKEPMFKKYFKHCYCPSELFAQTILCNSHFSHNIYNPTDERLGSLREIDWTRGSPYVWRNEDFNDLISSECMFARKFDPNTDNEIINKLINHLIRQ